MRLATILLLLAVMLGPIHGCRVDAWSSSGTTAAAAHFQLELGLFFGQQFQNPQSLGSVCRFGRKSAISFNIFPADEPVHWIHCSLQTGWQKITLRLLNGPGNHNVR
ncbi:MAG: hypothetical protein WBF64_05250 [Xanthobacteraceae bacterium]